MTSNNIHFLLYTYYCVPEVTYTERHLRPWDTFRKPPVRPIFPATKDEWTWKNSRGKGVKTLHGVTQAFIIIVDISTIKQDILTVASDRAMIFVSIAFDM